MKRYIAIIHKDEGTEYGISFPDFLGCVSSGKTLAEARANGLEALQLHLEGMAEDKITIPEPMAIDDAMASELAQGAVFVTDVDIIPPVKFERVNIMVREDHLAAIDRAAKDAGKNRSEYMVERSLGRIPASSAKTKQPRFRKTKIIMSAKKKA